MLRLSPPVSVWPRVLWLWAFAVLSLASSVLAQDIKIQSFAPDFPGGQFFKLTDTIPWNFTVGRSSDDITQTQAARYVIFVTGPDIYGNTVYIEVSRGRIPSLVGGGTVEIKGEWRIPDDGTLFSPSIQNYQFRLHIYPNDPVDYPKTLAELSAVPALLQRVTSFGIDVIPNLAIGVPGVTYPAGTYRGGDIVQFAVTYGNSERGETYKGVRIQSRPLRSVGRDRYRLGIRLSTNAEYDDASEPPPPGGEEDEEEEPAAEEEDETITTVSDDFSLMRVGLSGDLRNQVVPDGSSQIRKVETIGNYAPVPPYGISGIADSVRTYTPQPEDGFLDLGEAVTMYTEQLMPENFAGEYFVLGRVFMRNDSTQSNNTFSSFAANKITLLETASPTIEPASAIVTREGEFIRPGNGSSDASSVSADGNLIAFSSRASNLRVPAILFEQFKFLYGDDADPASIPDPPSEEAGSASASVLAEVKSLLTTNQQIFLRYRQSRETQHVSRTKGGVQADQDCFNPSLSADGNHVAYDTTADNLLPQLNTGGRSMIYVFNRNTEETVLVSRSADGEVANGSCFNPQISKSGRFVVFESLATNLDSTKTPNGVHKQIYLHDRNVDGRTDEFGRPIFDVSRNIATYLVSVDRAGRVANNLCDQPAINTVDFLEVNGSQQFKKEMFVAYVSYASNLPQATGNAMVYHVRVVVDPQGRRGPVLSSVDPVSVNDAGEAASATGVDLVNAWINPYSIEPALNGDGSLVAFTSAATTLVRNDRTGGFQPTYPNNNPFDARAPVVANLEPQGDFNRVPDVFLRNLLTRKTTRVSISDERVATGIINFVVPPWSNTTQPAGVPAGNIAVGNQVAPDDSISISDGGGRRYRFVFDPTGTLPPQDGYDDVAVIIGANIQQTRDNLIDKINASALTINAFATTPPNVPGAGSSGYRAAIYLRNRIPGGAGNQAVTVNGVVTTAIGGGANGNIYAYGMSGGGRQAEDDALTPGDTAAPPVQGVPLGSGQPSISEDGRFVAFRSVASNLDIFRSTEPNNVQTLQPWQRPNPITGELIRPLIYPAGNVYLHDVAARSTKRVSVSKFGYPATVDGYTRPLLSGVNLNRTPNSSAPAISADGRFVSFSTDSEGLGGLVFGANNMQQYDYRPGTTTTRPALYEYGDINNRFRDVLVYDRFQTGKPPAQVDTEPELTIVSPFDNTIYTTGNTVVISAEAAAARNKRIASVEFRVNEISIATQTAAPYRVSQLLQSPGAYNITVIATDNFGVQTTKSVRVTARAPIGQPPTVGITHPNDQPPPTAGGTATTPAVARFSTASTFYINSLLIPGFGTTIDASKVRFLANGEPISGTISKLGDQYGILWRPPANAIYEIVAEGTDSNNNTVVSAPLSIQIAPVARPLPTIAMTKVFAAGVPRVGSTLQVEADFQSNSSTRVTRVDFYANSVFIGSFTPGAGAAGLAGTASVQWLPETAGTYTLSARAVQIDQATGSHSIVSTNALTQQIQEAKPLPPGKTAPVVLLTDPISEPRLVLGSEVYININATDPDDARSIATDKVMILINGEPQSDVRRYGNTWSVRWKPTETGLFTIQATAEDREGYSSVLPAFSVSVFRGLRPLPQVQMLPLDAAAQLNNTTTYKLQARAFFPPLTTDQARVDFYANGVLLGSGFVARPAGNDGFATYQFDWKPTATTGGDVASLRLSAKATSRNFFSFTQVENVEQQNQIEFYGASLSNELDPVTVSGVTSTTPNQSFVVDLYSKIFYRAPNYGEWKYYVDRLNSGALSQSQVIMEVMGYDPALQKFNYRNLYGQTSGMALAAYYRLKLSPSGDPFIQDFINTSLGDTTLLPITVYPAPGLAAPPYGATSGMGKAFQEIIDSAAFNRSYRLVRGYSNQRFVAWMRDVVFPRRPLGQLILVSGTGGGSTLPPTTSGNTATGRPGQSTNTGNNASNDGAPANNASNGNTTGGTSGGGTGTTTGGTTGGATVTAGLMENPTVEGYPQGAAMAFLSRLVVASYSDTEKVFQRQMATTALNFQLSGGRVWDPDLYKRAGYGLFSDAVVRKILSTYPVGTSAATALQARNRQLAGMAGTYRGTIAAGALNSLAGGTIEVTANSKGVVTGALTMNGRAYAFRGAIGQDGKVSAVAQGLPGERSYLLNLSFNAPGTNSARITGTVTSGTDKVSLTAAVQDNQAVRNARKIQTMAGRYEGVVHRAALNGQAGGAIRINSDAKGAVSGQVRINGRAFSFRGKVDPNGRISARTDAVTGLPRYDLALQLLQPGSASAAHVTGALSTGKQKATVRAHISPWNTRKTAALYSGRFKLAMNPAPAGRKPAASVPRGPRTAELSVGNDGTVILKGQLGAGAPITWTGRLTGDGRVLLQSPVKANGSVVGTVTVTNKGGRKSVSGALDWTKPSVGKQKGFKVNLRVVQR